MKIKIVSAGSFKDAAAKELFDSYLKKCRWDISLKEISQSKKSEAKLIIAEEGKAIQSACSDAEIIVALDKDGKQISSAELAVAVQKWQVEGVRTAAFIIGGAEGLTPEILKKATLTISFGKATWPHLLCRVMLAEQLYRAYSIIEGHPYHRG